MTRVRHCALHDREGVDVDERVAEADQHHRQRGNRDGRPDGDRDQRQRPEKNADAEVERKPPALCEDERDQPADQTTDADDGVEVPDPRRPDVEQVEADRDDEDGRRPGDDTLRAEEPDQEAKIAVAEDHAEAGARVPDEPLGLRRLSCLLCRHLPRREPEHEQHRPEKGDAVDDEDRLDVRNGEQDAPERRPREHPDAVERARGDVRGRQFTRVSRERRQKGGLSGTEARRRDGRPDHERIHEDGRPVHGDHHRACQGERRANEVGQRHHELARVAVGERRRDRERDRHRQIPSDSHDTDRRRPALCVRVDRDCDGERPVADDRADERELEAPQAGIPEDVGEGGAGLAQPVSESVHVRTPPHSLDTDGERRNGQAVRRSAIALLAALLMLVRPQRPRRRRARSSPGS